MVPLWLFLLIAIALGITLLLLIALCYLHFVQNPLPFPDWGNAIFVCPTKTSRKALFLVLKKHGITPDKRVASEFVDRAIFFRRLRFIVNVTEPLAWDQLGNPVAGIAIVVKNPFRAAEEAAHILRQAGYRSQVFENPDPDVLPGALAIVKSDALPRLVLVFRQHFIKMGPPPRAWKDED